jgi:hypothetical protein
MSKSQRVPPRGDKEPGRGPQEDIHATAAAGLRGSGATIPHAARIQQSFGHHDVSGIRAHTGGAARDANAAMGSLGYASGDHVAFAGAPSLHTAAHEAAHFIQQRAGVQLKGGVGQVGDAYERHADAVADRVVQGRSAEDLLDQFATPHGSATTGIQMRRAPVQFNPPTASAPAVSSSASSRATTVASTTGDAHTPNVSRPERPDAGPSATADSIREAHPNGMPVALSVAPTFANAEEQRQHRANLDNPETRAAAMRLVDVALWKGAFLRWAQRNPGELDRLAGDRRSAQPTAGANPALARRRLAELVWREKKQECKVAMLRDPEIRAFLNSGTHTQSQEFVRQGDQFARAHRAAAAEGTTLTLGRGMQFTNPTDLQAKARGVAAAASALGLTGNAAKIRQLAIFTHGWRTGMAGRNAQGGADVSNPEALASGLSNILTEDVHVALFACGTAGSGGRANGSVEGSFADRLRDALQAQHRGAVVLGHQEDGHTVGNENVRILAAGGANETRAHDPLRILLDANLQRTVAMFRRLYEERHPGVSVTPNVFRRAHNKAAIYWYNREFFFTVSAELAADPTRLREAANTWWLQFVETPAGETGVMARIVGHLPPPSRQRRPSTH